MRKDKEIATEMRKEGKSYSEMSERLKIPKTTLSDWFKKEDWSKEIRGRLADAANAGNTVRIIELGKVRGEELKTMYEEAKEEAKREFETLKYHPLFIAGLSLYFGAGDKAAKTQVRLANTNPELVRLFVGFLEKACRIPPEKVKASLVLYPGIDEQSSLRFWVFAAGIPLNRFRKSSLVKGRQKPKGVAYGMCAITVSNTYFKVKVTEWLKTLPKELMKREYYENI